MKMVSLFIILSVAILLLLWFALGMRARIDKNNFLSASHNAKSIPLGIIRVIRQSGDKPVTLTELRAFNEIYTSLGVTEDRFAQWEQENGYGSQGKDKAGKLFIPDFPIFSKVAWMYIDPVDLSYDEVQQLIDECTRAINSNNNRSAIEELTRIRKIALEASAQSATLRFDQP